mmetsp:Transcript_101389/g.287288  ORF Transcript_101389/g.287288 Transcript_101389/m.287288 type:complete len:182 (-) Transcript_101389:93-638(-)|eukprot:CAMPEP_0179258488 /NCGR_PEP_ID=MMETSP0797-20121207/25341_1 /TAXON_ID=47934 /ORGANISM="Dinophysis acuminata, Strain DAEP01" /LENGTH=181 /DNA_ID=CAMNT_0020966521 /DNA_START=133 /DNA_END=678 /DNA_ORIENTATION=+
MIDPSTKASGEDYNAYCRRRWGGDGWTYELRDRGKREGLPFANWATWPNTFNAHRLCTFLEDRDRRSGLDEKEIAARNVSLVNKFYELTYERGLNISTPEGAALAVAELGYAAQGEAEDYLGRGGGRSEVAQADSRAKGEMDIHGVPFFVISREGSSKQPVALNGAQSSGSFLRAFQQQLP